MIKREWPAHSYEASMWDVINNAHRYMPSEGDKVLDLGAHYGMFALYAAARGADVVAYEPVYSNFVELQHTARVAEEIGFGQIAPVNAAIWRNDGTIPLWKRESKPCFSALTRIPNEEMNRGLAMHQVKAISLDNAIGETEWSCVKVDIEGAEHAALMSCHKFRQIRFLTIEIHNDLLSLDECDGIDALLHRAFGEVHRLPVKKNPAQTVAYFCIGGK